MAGSLSERKARELKKTGLSGNQLKRVDELVRAAPSGMAKSPPLKKDSCMLTPVEEWDRTDKKGRWGQKVFKFPSRRYRERYEQIDWTA